MKPIQTPYDDDDDDLTLPRRAALPDALLLLGETADNRYLPLEVDGNDRLVLSVASLKYIARTVQLLTTARAELEDTPGYLFEVNLTNVTAGALDVTLFYSDTNPPPYSTVVWSGSVPANRSLMLPFMLPIGDKTLWAIAGAANSVYALCSLHEGRDYVR